MDDFSFPTIAAAAADRDSLCQLPFPHFAASPLWFLSSVPKQKPIQQRRRSFSSASSADACDNLTKDLESSDAHLSSPTLSAVSERFIGKEEEKMDLLWEDFDKQELVRISCDKRKAAEKFKGKPKIRSKSERGHDVTTVELCCAQELDMAKTSSMVHHRRPSLVVMLRLLKKLFLIQDQHSSKRARHDDG